MEKLKTVFARVMNMKESEINENSSPENVESWDSFNSLMLISELEKNFNAHFTTEEITSVKNYGDIVKILKKHGLERQI